MDPKLKRIIFSAALIIAALGAINWGTISMGYNMLGSTISNNTLRKCIYILIGVAGLITLYFGVMKAADKEPFMNPSYNDVGQQATSRDGEYSNLGGTYDAMQ